ncbi:MAG: DUF1800 domain-containing protein [Pseudomonadota bacterium]
MTFDPTLASIRFGMGLSPRVAPPRDVDDMLADLLGPDEVAQRFAIPPFSEAEPSPRTYAEAARARNAARGTEGEAEAEAVVDALRDQGREAVLVYLRAELARAVDTRDGFRERLTQFWADHFTVRAVRGIDRHFVSPYIEEAIRPHVAGTFGDMLVAAILSPMMIFYLDQHQSMGPNSRTAQNRDRGLNENLARELLELHTLGVGGGYSQTDVRQMAELLTGVTFNATRGAYFREQQAEPGSETVLGVTYGGAEESLDHVVAALRDLAVHPSTAAHLSRKVAVHFIGPDPDAEMVDAMAARYLDTGGHLPALYEAMLRHHAAWGADLAKVKLPFQFIGSAMRALDVPVQAILAASPQDTRRIVQRPLAVMGQVWQTPVGPDGWSEKPEDWITPQGMAGRITWSMTMPQQLVETLPDPRDFVRTALGPDPDDAVIFAAEAAANVRDGIGIILASAAFQRR